MIIDHVLSIDLGTERDPTAFTVLKRVKKLEKPLPVKVGGRLIRPLAKKTVSEIHLAHMSMAPLKTPYHEIVQKAKYMMLHPKYAGKICMVVDKTGVGNPVMQQMWQEGLSPIGITYHGGDTVRENDGHYTVPKRDLVTALLTALQMRRFRMPRPEQMKIIEEFEKQLKGFQMKINKNGHDTYEAAMERIHDDLVMSASMGVWWMNKLFPPYEVIEEA